MSMNKHFFIGYYIFILNEHGHNVFFLSLSNLNAIQLSILSIKRIRAHNSLLLYKQDLCLFKLLIKKTCYVTSLLKYFKRCQIHLVSNNF